MKIGILTYYHDLNCGTTLQAYATLQAVKEVYPNEEVELIPYRNFNRRYLPYKYQATFFTLIKDFCRIRKYRIFLKKYLRIREDYLNIDTQKGLDFIKARNYDRIYIGADTILELDTLPNGVDGLTTFWLSEEIKAPKYLIAASSKNVSYENLSDKQKKDMQKCINALSSIMLRDTATYELFSHFTDINNIEMICDPTFTLQIDYSYAEKYVAKKKIDFSKVICFHPIKGEKWCFEVAEKLRKDGFKVASLRPAKWADYVMNDMGPLEQLGIYKYFACFITHRFHDTVFCIKNSAPVVLYPYKDEFYSVSGHSKYSAICDMFNIRHLSYIEKKSDITPQLMYEKIHHVMNTFSIHIPSINRKRDELVIDYYEKLESTRFKNL